MPGDALGRRRCKPPSNTTGRTCSALARAAPPQPPACRGCKQRRSNGIRVWTLWASFLRRASSAAGLPGRYSRWDLRVLATWIRSSARSCGAPREGCRGLPRGIVTSCCEVCGWLASRFEPTTTCVFQAKGRSVVASWRLIGPY